MMKTIVIGLGNPILGDDGVGWRAAEALGARPEAAGVEIDTLASGGLGLMERMVGYDRAIVIDALQTGNCPEGSLQVFPLDALENSFAGHLGSAHESNLQTALQVGLALGAHLPAQVTVIAVETPHVYDFSAELSPAAAAAVPAAVEAALQILFEDGGPHDLT